MTWLKKYPKIVWPAVLFALFFSMAAWAGEPAETPLFENQRVGTVFLRNVTPDKVDMAYLVDSLEKLAAAVDGHQVSYLKMLIDENDDVVKDMVSGPHVVVRRGPQGMDGFIVPLKSYERYFLRVTGRALYSAGEMPPGLDFGKCTAGQ